MDQNIKIIFVDIDWTILSHYKGKHVFDKASIRALKKAQKRGVKVCICTARAYHSVVYTGLLKIFKPDGLIISNGGLVMIDDKIIKEINFTEKNYQKMIDVANELGLTMQITEETMKKFIIGKYQITVDDIKKATEIKGRCEHFFEAIEDFSSDNRRRTY